MYKLVFSPSKAQNVREAEKGPKSADELGIGFLIGGRGSIHPV